MCQLNLEEFGSVWHINIIHLMPFRSPLVRQPRNMTFIAPHIQFKNELGEQ